MFRSPSSTANTPALDSLLLDGDTGDYEYLNKSRREVDGVDDQEEWYALKVHIVFISSKALHAERA